MTRPAGPALPAPPSARAGFTLIEVIVVITVLALVVGIVVSRGPVRSARLEMDGAARDVAAAFRTARSQAIAQDRPVRVTIDAAAHAVQIDGALPRRLPGAYPLTVTSALGARLAQPAVIAFLPDGSSTGGAVQIVGPHRRVAVGVDWLTGRVTLADGA